ncbi:MAG TPA: hypothetical protein VGZ47_06860 [Gemmataceae bacterium]|jgi:hypothetical protein|nr:hypothetical protein [Gemmataceae bacterium]
MLKRILGGVAVVGALAVLPAVASAHDYYHHHYYRPYYYPSYYYTPVVVTPAPVIVTPAVTLDVFYRVGPYQTWTFYGNYPARSDADYAAHRLEDRGYSVMIQTR